MAKELIMLLSISWLGALSLSQAAVLDPALFLSASPPLSGHPMTVDQWLGSLDPAELANEPGDSLEPEESAEEQEPPRARTFWPLRPTYYGIRGVHIPLTFSMTGTYGTNSGVSAGVIGSSYASVADDTTLVNYSKSGLAGSSYGLYRAGLPGTRIYGGSGGTGWSGWGNGKWGHYGKG